MPDSFVHVDINVEQCSKRRHDPCGDVFLSEKTADGATLVLADGLGSGVKAHIAAEMAVGRIKGLLGLGHSLHRIMNAMVRDMEKMRAPDRPFAALSVLRIQPDGLTAGITYESPGPILVSRGTASALNAHPVELGGALCSEYNCYLEPQDAVILTSDGITQAGIGNGLPLGWTTEGIVRFINDRIARKSASGSIPKDVLTGALNRWREGGDDCTVAMALARRGHCVNVLSGPPGSRGKDAEVVERFMQSPGKKIICGGTTAEMVARETGKVLQIEQILTSKFAPPRFRLEGVDLVTEGAITLNQVYNLLGDDPELIEEEGAVKDMLKLICAADRVNIFCGTAKNRAHGDYSFKLRGVLSRERVIPLLCEKLKSMGRLVVCSTL